jgi:hypothetical protein
MQYGYPKNAEFDVDIEAEKSCKKTHAKKVISEKVTEKRSVLTFVTVCKKFPTYKFRPVFIF